MRRIKEDILSMYPKQTESFKWKQMYIITPNKKLSKFKKYILKLIGIETTVNYYNIHELKIRSIRNICINNIVSDYDEHDCCDISKSELAGEILDIIRFRETK